MRLRRRRIQGQKERQTDRQVQVRERRRRRWWRRQAGGSWSSRERHLSRPRRAEGGRAEQQTSTETLAQIWACAHLWLVASSQVRSCCCCCTYPALSFFLFCLLVADAQQGRIKVGPARSRPWLFFSFFFPLPSPSSFSFFSLELNFSFHSSQWACLLITWCQTVAGRSQQ